MEKFVVAGGCFWCLDAVYRTLEGVTDVVSGYTGGATINPSYDAVCSGATGHAEAVEVTFDPQLIPREVILDVFFSLHDPRQLNRQGADVGTQYRSAMFYTNDEQRGLFEAARERASEVWEGEAVTTIAPLGDYYRAEEYHQDFFAKNPEQGYCMAVALPKVNKVRTSFTEYIRAS